MFHDDTEYQIPVIRAGVSYQGAGATFWFREGEAQLQPAPPRNAVARTLIFRTPQRNVHRRRACEMLVVLEIIVDAQQNRHLRQLAQLNDIRAIVCRIIAAFACRGSTIHMRASWDPNRSMQGY